MLTRPSSPTASGCCASGCVRWCRRAPSTHGDGAGWLDARVEALLGLHDDPSGFAPTGGPLRELWRRFPGARVGRTGTLWHDLAWWVVQQRVTRQDADAQWRRLVTALGEPVDGVDEPFAPAEQRLRAVPGIGPWTAAGLSATTWGEPDTVLVGDDGIPSLVTWLLAREPTGDDGRMLELLEPYRPHRYRVVRLAFLGGVRPPRRAPRGRRTDVRGR